jgi:tetratricopeptide (TPR) repeat protein
MSPEPHNSVEVFYSYAHEDEDLRKELEKHLSNLRRQGVITGWHDRQISAGKDWDREIDEHLNSAKVILLLISPDFMNSDYINDVEVKRAMERHEAGEARVIPVILRPVDWRGAPFSKLQAVPKDARPVTLWPNQDEAFVDVTTGIRATLEKLSNPSATMSAALDIPSPPKVGFVPRRDRDDHDFIERVRNELEPGKKQLVVLWGAGGVGKTAIAVEAVRGLIEPFAKRIAWVSADGLDSFSLTTLLDSIATQLGQSELRKLPLDLKREQVRDLVKTAPTLIVLDNFETIESAERAHCIDWLGKPAPCTALITTRDMIENARNIPIDVMRSDEANNLLDQLIVQAHEARAFVNLDRERLIQTAEANPLVLQWIVGQIDLAQDPNEVLDELRHGEGSAAERVFNRSFELKQLNNGGRAVLLALSLFAPSATRKAVAEVSGFGKESDKKKFRDAVKSLSALWLIHTTDESRRLAVEGLTRELTKARLDNDPRGKIFTPRFITRFARFAEIHKRPAREDYDAVELEKDNLLNAADLAFAQEDFRSVFRLAYALAVPPRGALIVRGLWDEALQLADRALKIARKSQLKSEIGNWSHNVAILYHDRGELQTARVLYEESLEIKKDLDQKSGMANTLHALGALARARGELIEAKRLFDESLIIRREIGEQGTIANSLHALGNLAFDRGEFSQARRYLDEALALNRQLDDALGIASDLGALAALEYQQGDLGESRRLYDQSLEISNRQGDRRDIASSLNGIGVLCREQGMYAQARQFHTHSLDINKKLGSQLGISSSLINLGVIAQEERVFEEADRLYNEALVIDKKIDNVYGIAVILHQLGTLSLVQRDYENASPLLLDSMNMLKRFEDKVNYAECLESMGRLGMAQGRHNEAQILFDEALEIAQTLGIPFRIASVKRSLGLLAEKQNDKVLAAQFLSDALPIFEKLHSPKAKEVQHDLERVEGESSEVP